MRKLSRLAGYERVGVTLEGVMASFALSLVILVLVGDCLASQGVTNEELTRNTDLKGVLLRSILQKETVSRLLKIKSRVGNLKRVNILLKKYDISQKSNNKKVESIVNGLERVTESLELYHPDQIEKINGSNVAQSVNSTADQSSTSANEPTNKGLIEKPFLGRISRRQAANQLVAFHASVAKHDVTLTAARQRFMFHFVHGNIGNGYLSHGGIFAVTCLVPCVFPASVTHDVNGHQDVSGSIVNNGVHSFGVDIWASRQLQRIAGFT